MTTGRQDEAVQDRAWPEGTCYGCGPANEEGLQLKSYVSGERLVARFDPDPTYNSGAANVMYGGLVASLIDCHSVWTAIAAAHRAADRPLTDDPLMHVTAELDVDYRKPTPLDEPVHLDSRVTDERGRRARVRCELGPEDAVTAVGDVLAVRVADADHHQGESPV